MLLKLSNVLAQPDTVLDFGLKLYKTMPETKTKFIKNGYKSLVILTLAYLLVRSAVLFTSIDKIHLDEEEYRGNVAKELISGPILPLFDYQRSEYEGGSLVNGILATPFFLIFGETLLSLKLVGLLAGLMLFILWFLFLDEFFNKKVAVLASILHILPPFIFTRVSLSVIGAQEQSGIFTILAACLFYKIIFKQAKRTIFVFLGLVCGFGLFFSYVFLLTLLTILLLWFLFDKRFILRKDFLAFVIFFFIGFSPWICYNLTHNFEGFIVSDQPALYWFTQNSPFDSLSRLIKFTTVDIVNSFEFCRIGFLSGKFLSYAYYLVFVVSFCVLLFLNRKVFLGTLSRIIPGKRFNFPPAEPSKYMLLLIFPIVFSTFYSFTGISPKTDFYSSYVLRYRNVLPLYPFIFAFIAIFLHKISNMHKYFHSSYFAPILMGALIFPGLISNARVVTVDNLRRSSLLTIYRGYNYYNLGRVIAWRFDGSSKWIDSVKSLKNAEARRYCYSGMGWGYAEDKFNADYTLYLGTIIHKIERDYWPYAYEWMGEALERGLRYDKSTAAGLRNYLNPDMISYFYGGVGRQAVKEIGGNPEQALIDFRKRIDEEYAPYFFKGIGVELFSVLTDRPKIFYRFMNSVDARFKPLIYEGMAQGREYYRFIYGDFGFGIGKIGYDIGKWGKIMSKMEIEYRPFCYERLGIEIGWRFIHGVKEYLSFLRATDQEYRLYLYRGLGTGIGWRFAYDLKGCVKLIQNIDQAFWPYVYQGLGMGVARRYAYQEDAWANESKEIPVSYRSFFYAGIKDASSRKYGGYN